VNVKKIASKMAKITAKSEGKAPFYGNGFFITAK
jgi:hypothetical protein